MSNIKEEIIEELNEVKTARDLMFFLNMNYSYFENTI